MCTEPQAFTFSQNRATDFSLHFHSFPVTARHIRCHVRYARTRDNH